MSRFDHSNTFISRAWRSRQIRSPEEASDVEVLRLRIPGRSSLNGLDVFPNLRKLQLDVSGYKSFKDGWLDPGYAKSRSWLSDLYPLRYLPKLEVFSLHFDSLASLNGIQHCQKLKKLILRPQETTPLSDRFVKKAKDLSFLVELTKLTQLDMPHQAICDISPLEGLKNLCVLDLSYNRIEDISILRFLPSLKSLWISGNPIRDTALLEILKQSGCAIDDVRNIDLDFFEKDYI